MKRMVMGFTALALALSLGTMGAWAASRVEAAPQSIGLHKYCPGYADEDGDGVCDNRGAYCPGYTDEDGDGVCDNRGAYCPGYADENGDGLCDNRGTGAGLGARCRRGRA